MDMTSNKPFLHEVSQVTKNKMLNKYITSIPLSTYLSLLCRIDILMH